MAQSDLKNYEKAEDAFRDALKLDKTDGEAWFDLGLVYLQQREFEQAENSFSNAVKFRSVSASDAFNNLGVIFALRHEFDKAEKQFETALKLSNNQSNTARNNLQFCKYYRQKNQSKDLIAKLEFSNQSQNHLRLRNGRTFIIKANFKLCNTGGNATVKERVLRSDDTLPNGRVSACIFVFHLTENCSRI
jgi:Flp pilus assembly protein TadD